MDEKKPCTCDPEDAPVPCAHKYASHDCIVVDLRARLTAAERANGEMAREGVAAIGAARVAAIRQCAAVARRGKEVFDRDNDRMTVVRDFDGGDECAEAILALLPGGSGDAK